MDDRNAVQINDVLRGIDGLVSLGGKSSRRVLSEALARAKTAKSKWIEEAIAQVRESGAEES